eukprot:1185124-Prorocentrum_minimum.AAC.2
MVVSIPIVHTYDRSKDAEPSWMANKAATSSSLHTSAGRRTPVTPCNNQPRQTQRVRISLRQPRRGRQAYTETLGSAGEKGGQGQKKEGSARTMTEGRSLSAAVVPERRLSGFGDIGDEEMAGDEVPAELLGCLRTMVSFGLSADSPPGGSRGDPVTNRRNARCPHTPPHAVSAHTHTHKHARTCTCASTFLQQTPRKRSSSLCNNLGSSPCPCTSASGRCRRPWHWNRVRKKKTSGQLGQCSRTHLVRRVELREDLQELLQRGAGDGVAVVKLDVVLEGLHRPLLAAAADQRLQLLLGEEADRRQREHLLEAALERVHQGQDAHRHRRPHHRVHVLLQIPNAARQEKAPPRPKRDRVRVGAESEPPRARSEHSLLRALASLPGLRASRVCYGDSAERLKHIRVLPEGGGRPVGAQLVLRVAGQTPTLCAAITVRSPIHTGRSRGPNAQRACPDARATTQAAPSHILPGAFNNRAHLAAAEGEVVDVRVAGARLLHGALLVAERVHLLERGTEVGVEPADVVEPERLPEHRLVEGRTQREVQQAAVLQRLGHHPPQQPEVLHLLQRPLRAGPHGRGEEPKRGGDDVVLRNRADTGGGVALPPEPVRAPLQLVAHQSVELERGPEAGAHLAKDARPRHAHLLPLQPAHAQLARLAVAARVAARARLLLLLEALQRAREPEGGAEKVLAAAVKREQERARDGELLAPAGQPAAAERKHILQLPAQLGGQLAAHKLLRRHRGARRARHHTAL